MLAQLRRGVAWTYASVAASGMLQIGVVAVTARLLPAEAFGLIAMANVVLRFGSYFAQMGVGRALVQRQQIDDDDVRAAFTSSTVLGGATALIVFAAAPIAAGYFQTDEVVPVMRWLALTFVVTGLGATARALLQRQLRFRASSAIEVASYALGYAVPTLVLAANGYGVWSLVAGAIGQAAVTTAASMALARHSLWPMLRWAPHARLLRFGATVSGISVLEFLGAAMDTLIIGRFGTPAQLGVYNRAFMLASLPTYQVNQGIAKVLFPVLSAGRADPAAFATALTAATRSAIKLVVPLGVGMGLTAPELIHVVLGDAWPDAVPVFAILAPVLALNLLATFPGQALDAVGRLRWKAVMQSAYVAALAMGLLSASYWGLDLRRVTAVVGTAIALRVLAVFVLALRVGVVSPGSLMDALRTAVVAALATAATFLAVLTPLRSLGAAPMPTLLAAVAAGGVVVMLAFRADVVRLLRER